MAGHNLHNPDYSSFVPEGVRSVDDIGLYRGVDERDSATNGLHGHQYLQTPTEEGSQWQFLYPDRGETLANLSDLQLLEHYADPPYENAVSTSQSQLAWDGIGFDCGDFFGSNPAEAMESQVPLRSGRGFGSTNQLEGDGVGTGLMDHEVQARAGSEGMSGSSTTEYTAFIAVGTNPPATNDSGFAKVNQKSAQKRKPANNELTTANKTSISHSQRVSGRVYCEECSLNYTTMKCLNAHIRRVHEGRYKITCEKCKKVYSEMNGYNRHLPRCGMPRRLPESANSQTLRWQECYPK